MTGCGIAHGIPVGNEVSSHAVVFALHPSDQLYSGRSYNAETDSGVGAIKPRNHVYVASSHVQHEDSDDASSGINPGDEIKPEASPVQSSKHEKSTYLHPLPLLVKQMQKETIEGLSFPTVQYFKQFVESMKNSYLTPGNDLSRYFQTARDVMENEFNSNAQDPTADYRPDSSEENSDHDEIWNESTNSEENEHDVHFRKLSVPDSAPSAAGSSFGEKQDSDLTMLAQLTADRPASKGYGSLEAGDLFTGLETAAGAQNRDTHPVSLRLTEQMPSGSLFGELAPAEALIGSAHGAAPDLDPKTSEGMIQESDSEDSLKYENPSGGFLLGGFQKKDLREKIPADVLYSPKASPHVGHINNGNVSGHVPKERESLSSSQTHQSTAGEGESKGLYRSIVHLPEFGSSASSNTDLSPRGRWGQAGDQLSSPHHLDYEAFGRRQPLRSQHVERNIIFGINELKQMSDDVQAFSAGGSDSAQRWISSPYEVDYGLHILTKLAQPSPSDTIFWRKIGQEHSRNSKMKNIISDDPNMTSSFFTPRKRGMTLKSGFVGPAEAAIPHTSMQDTIYWPPHPIYAFQSLKSGAFQRSGARRGHFYQTGDSLSLPFYTTKTRSNYFRSKVSLLKTHYAPH